MRVSSGGVVGLHPALEARTRRADRTSELVAELRTVARAAIKQTQTDFLAADSLTGLTVLPEGIVRLTDVITTLITKAGPPNNYFTGLDRTAPFDTLFIQWGGTQSFDFELQRLKIHMHPRISGSQRQEVAFWKLDLFRIVRISGTSAAPRIELAQLCDPLKVPVPDGAAEGLVTFDFTGRADRPRPKFAGLVVETGEPLIPVTIGFLYALKADGSFAANAGIGYDSTTERVNTGGNVLTSFRLTGIDSRGLYIPGVGGAGGLGPSLGTPICTVETGTYTSAKISFSGGGNKATLVPAGTPTGDVVFTCQGPVPEGCSLVGKVLKDGGNPVVDGDWVTFLDGQKNTDLVNVSKKAAYELRAELNTNAAGNQSPQLWKLAVEEITPVDLTGLAEVEDYSSGVDPMDCKGEIAQLKLRIVKDGPYRDFQSLIENTISSTARKNLQVRLYVGDRSLSRDKWLHKADFLVEEPNPDEHSILLTCLSPLALVRSLLPAYSPGVAYHPDGTLSTGAWRDQVGGTNLHLAIDEAIADETDWIQSNAAAGLDTCRVSLSTPSDSAGRRHIIEYEYFKDVSGGAQINLTVRLKQSNVTKAANLHTDIGPLAVTGSFELTDAEIQTLTDLPNLELEFEKNEVSGAPSRRAIVTWAQFRLGGKREGVSYVNQTRRAVLADLLQNRLAIPGRLLGPGTLDLNDTTTLLTKALVPPSKRLFERENLTSKTEVDAVCRIGYAGPDGRSVAQVLIESQGRLKVIDLDAPRANPIIFWPDEVEVEDCSPGLSQATPEFFAKWRWDVARGDFTDEVRAKNDAARDALGDLFFEQPRELDEEVGKYIQDEATANRVAFRQVDYFGAAYLDWGIRIAYPYPEAEEGDLVLVPTEKFCAFDPIASRALKGKLWVLGIIRKCLDGMGHRFRIYLRGFNDILGTTEAARMLGFVAPIVRAVGLHVDDGGNVVANISVTGGLVVRVAVSTAGEPSDATTRVAPLQLLNANSQLTTATLVSIIPGQIAYVKVFAYERGDGSGAESSPVTAVTPKGTRKRAFVFDDGLFVLRAGNPTGIAAHSSVQLDPANGVAEGGTVYRIYRHREEITVNGADADGDVAVSFSLSYQNPPLIILRGGQYLSFATAFGTGVNHRQRLQALNITTSGFTSRAQMLNAGVVTGQNDDFPSGNLLVNVSDTAEADLQPGGANDDSYTVNYRVTVTNPDGSANVSVTVAIEINRQDGNGWITAASYGYSRNIAGTQSWNSESKTILATGLGTGDDIRIRISSFDDNGIGGSFTVRGADGAGSNPDTRNGVTYNTASDTTASAIPNNGDQVIWVAQEVT